MLGDLADGLARLLHQLPGPGRCAHCRGPAPAVVALCDACEAALPWLQRPCPRCALPGGPCRATRCPGRGGPLDGAWAAFEHVGPARTLVAAGKRGAPPALDRLAEAMLAGLPESVAVAAGLVVPVPADPVRARVRGGDHARRLAHRLATGLGVPSQDLLRRDATSRQRGADREARRHGARAARHRVADGVRVPTAVLLLDDVHTTGATLAASAAALRAAGAPRVVAVTATRAGRG